MKRNDLTGNRYGELLAISLETVDDSRAVWNFLCTCGKVVAIRGTSVTGGGTKSCGCKKGVATHGHNRVAGDSPTYNSWRGMVARCTNPNADNYKYYGGRGITVCERWLHSFVNFLSDMGTRPEGKTLDRENNSGNYEPGNCKWSSRSEQMFNRRKWAKHVASAAA